MKYICYLYLIMVCIQSINIPEVDILSAVQKNNWGKITLAMNQLAMQNNKSLKELEDAIQSIVTNIEDNIHRQEFSYKQIQVALNSRQQKLDISINDAITFRARNEDYIDSVLLQYIETINKRLVNLEANIKENRKEYQYLNNIRVQQNEHFLDKLNEYQHFTQMIDLCLSLLDIVENTGSLLQVDRIKLIAKSMFPQLGLNSEMQHIIQATEDDEDWTDRKTIRKLKSMFNELRVVIVNNQNDDMASEHEQQLKYDEGLQQLERDMLLFRRDAAENIYQLSVTQEKLQITKDALDEKKKEQHALEEEMALINEGQSLEDKLYDEQKLEYSSQLMACQQALQLIRQPDFRQKMDVII